MKNLKTFEGFFGFSRKDDDLAEKILTSLEDSIESNDGRVKNIAKYGDYKRSVTFQAKNSETIYNIAVSRSSGKDFTLIINHRTYIDDKTGKSTVSQSIARKIWNLLDSNQTKSWFGKDNILKDF